MSKALGSQRRNRALLVLTGLIILSLLAGFLRPNVPIAKAGNQAWSNITLPEVINAGKIRSLVAVDANTAFAAIARVQHA